MKIKLTSVFVTDQDKALKFYTNVLGFVKKMDLTVGQFKFITVTAADEPDGTELLFEPNDNPAALTYQQALYHQSIPAAAFWVDDVTWEYERLLQTGRAL
jgi:catechol 2,3-dioxygenase-like lactoylglutathione lyase family enzyme